MRNAFWSGKRSTLLLVGVGMLVLIWAQIARGQGYPPQGYSTTGAQLATVAALETTAALNLYVDALGNDANACTATGASACLTLAGARAKIPPRIRHPVVVTFEAGTYAGAAFSGFVFDPAAPAAGAYIQLTGPLANVTPATGSATGTATAGTAGTTSTYGTLTDSGATWTVNDFRGKFIVITAGTGSGQKKVIVSNTATAITIAGLWTAPTTSSTYAVQEPSASITTSVQQPALPGVAAATGAALIFSGSTNGLAISSTMGAFDVQQLKLAPATGDGVAVYGPVRVHTKLIHFTIASSSLRGIYVGGGESTSEECSFQMTGSGSQGISSVTAYSNPFIRVNNSFFRGGGSAGGIGLNLSSLGGCSVISAAFENFGTAGISIVNPISTTAISNVRIDCSSLGSAIGIQMQASASSAGSAPSGAFGTAFDVSNCITAVFLSGPAKYLNAAGVWSGTGNTTAIKVEKGARVQLSSSSTITGTTEISVDAVTATIAAMRGASPKTFPTTPNMFGSLVYE